jgi:inorganic pyrophosphatase
MKLGKRWVENIPSSDDPDAWVPVVNEISSGSSCKYRLDKVAGPLALARALPRDVAFPANHGLEELDVLRLSGQPILRAQKRPAR